jgi:hypothetical protein
MYIYLSNLLLPTANYPSAFSFYLASLQREYLYRNYLPEYMYAICQANVISERRAKMSRLAEF